jgi:DNA-binding SARP family transcriptional activator
MLRVRLLGAVAVERDGGPVAVPGSTRRLLAFLALRPGPHDRARFWPDVPQPAGRASLRTAVWGLRRAVGEDALAASRGTVGLCPEALRVDVAEVAALIAAGEDGLAVAQCRGELLADLDEDWAQSARAEHQARHAGLLDRLAECAETGGDAAAAVRWSRERCALTPLDEPAHCVLLRRLAAAGDRAGALATGRVAVGAGVDVGGEAPFAVWQELTRQLVRTVPAPPQDAGWPQELGRLAPDLATGLGSNGAPPARGRA